MKLVEVLDTNIDVSRLREEISSLMIRYDLTLLTQVSLTSLTGDNDWYSANGKISNLKYPERYFKSINEGIKDTYLEECIKRYKDFYRWRILKLSPKQSYSIHSDGDGVNNNIRLHIPIITNDLAFLAFYDQLPNHQQTSKVYYEHLPVGASYRVNTTHLHTAVNYGTTDRYHLVGVKYENSNNGSH